MLDLGNDLDILKKLHFAQTNITVESIHKDAKHSANQELFFGTADSNYDFEVENEKLELDKAECKRLQETIKQRTEELNMAEELLSNLQETKKVQKESLNIVDNKILTHGKEVTSLRRIQKVGSEDRRKLKLQSLLLKVYETLFKMKLHDSLMTEDNPKNFINGFIYNQKISYVKCFTFPLVRGIAWDLLPPAAQLSWSLDDEDAE